MLSDLGSVAREVRARLPEEKGSAVLVALVGDLGAGKTTFTQALARELGVVATVQSPTYVLMKSYQLPQGDALATGLSKASPFEKLIHIDAYRLESPDQFKALRPEEFLSDPNALIVVEWPERAGGFLPEPDLTVTFSADGAGAEERYIEVI